MPDLTIHLKMIGTAPTVWYEANIRYEGGVQYVTTTEKTAGNGVTFLGTLAELLKTMFERTKNAAKTSVTGIKTNIAPTVANVGTLDLLCYICLYKSDSVIKGEMPAEFAKSGKVGGLTSPIVKGEVYSGVVSEIYLDELKTNITVASFAVYHELMHNKTRWESDEDTEWVHREGDGLAEEGGPLQYKGLTDKTAKVMGARLPIVNRQFTGKV